MLTGAAVIDLSKMAAGKRLAALEEISALPKRTAVAIHAGRVEPTAEMVKVLADHSRRLLIEIHAEPGPVMRWIAEVQAVVAARDTTAPRGRGVRS